VRLFCRTDDEESMPLQAETMNRQTCACCNELFAPTNMTSVEASGNWLRHLRNRLTWQHTTYYTQGTPAKRNGSTKFLQQTEPTRLKTLSNMSTRATVKRVHSFFIKIKHSPLSHFLSKSISPKTNIISRLLISTSNNLPFCWYLLFASVCLSCTYMAGFKTPHANLGITNFPRAPRLYCSQTSQAAHHQFTTITPPLPKHHAYYTNNAKY
jgi:hypothetical protein